MYRQPFVVTIHDLILHHFPNRQASTLSPILYWIKYIGYRLVLRSTLTRALAIVAVSEFTAEDIQTMFPGVTDRLIVVPEATAAFALSHLRNDKKSGLLYTKDVPYVLVVGAFYPHKNLERLLRVWKEMSPQETLLLVGRDDAFSAPLRQMAERLGLTTRDQGKVHFFGQASDCELVALYKNARFLLIPSLYEGVGLPGLEAMANGVPVVSSGLAALPETYGPRALYIPVDSDEAMARALDEVLESQTEQRLRTMSFGREISPESVRQAFRTIFRNQFQT